MRDWRLAASLVTLRDQCNATWPERNKSADGTIGDAAHAATASDHNPNPQAVVCAFDLTHDPAHGVNCDAIAESLRLHPHADLKYLIWEGRIFSRYAVGDVPGFTWRPYHGADAHTSHIHVSVGVGRDGQSTPPYDDLFAWEILSSPTTPATPVLPKEPHDMVMFERPGVILLFVSQTLVALHSPDEFYKQVASGVQVLPCDDARYTELTRRHGQPI